MSGRERSRSVDKYVFPLTFVVAKFATVRNAIALTLRRSRALRDVFLREEGFPRLMAMFGEI